MSVDDLLCSASESQLRNVLAMVNIPDDELIALFEREQQMTVGTCTACERTLGKVGDTCLCGNSLQQMTVAESQN